MPVGRSQHDPGPPGELPRGVAVAQQSLKLGAIGGAKVKADVGTPHAPSMAHLEDAGNLVSGGEH